MKVKSHVFIGFLFLGITGCTGLSSDRYLANKQAFMLNHGNPPAYVAGYIDGCSTGRRLGGDRHFVYRKNNTRFEKDALYARGWQEAQINCRNEALAQDGMLEKETSNKKKADSGAADSASSVKSEKDKIAEEEMRLMWEELKK